MSELVVEKLVLTDTNDVNAYLVACPSAGEALIVDPGRYDPRLDELLTAYGCRLTYVFLTHGHHDHTGGVAELLERHREARLVAAPLEAARAALQPSLVAAPGEALLLGTAVGRFLGTPGHTPQGLSLAFEGFVFTGDALFSGSVGGTADEDLYDQQHEAIVTELLSLPDDTIVHPGHGPSSTVGVERRYNSFFVG